MASDNRKLYAVEIAESFTVFKDSDVRYPLFAGFVPANTFHSAGVIVSHSFVYCLFINCYPLAIGRLVAAEIIETFYRVCRRRSFAHVFEEVGKCLPSLTNNYSSSTVVMIFYMLRIPAAGEHILPSKIFYGSAAPVFI